MGVVGVVIGYSRQHGRAILVLHINYGQSILVVTEAYFSSLIFLVWTFVNDTLSIVDVTILSEATSKFRIEGVVHVNHVKTSCTGSCTHGVHESSILIGHDIVCAGHLVIVGVGLDPLGFIGGWVYVSEACQVEYLHAVVGGFADDEGVVFEDLS